MSNATGPVGAFPPPPGVVPDFENPRDAGWRLNIVVMTCMAAATTLFFGLRTYVKMTIPNQLLPEDCMYPKSTNSDGRQNLLEWALTLGLIGTSTVFVMAHHGEGYHAWEITKENYQEVMRWLYASSIIYCPGAYFTKVTLLLLEARVFAVYHRVARGIRIFIFTLLAGYIPLQTVKTIICLPVSAFWNPKTPNPRCLNQRKIFIADMCLAILTDVAILVIPIPLLWGLRMPIRKKLKILTLLGAGGIATAVTVYRMYLVVEFLSSTDVTADFVILDIVTNRFPQMSFQTKLTVESSQLELVIGVICACLPSINILYERIQHRMHAPDANVPRTTRDLKKNGSSSSYWWSVMTGKTKAARTVISMVEQRMQSTKRLPDFDTELATLTGQPVGKKPFSADDSGGNLSRNDDDWIYNPKANSVDGRREGWLAPEGDSSTTAVAKDRMPHWQHDEVEARRSWEAVWEKAIPPGRPSPIPDKDGPPQLKLTIHPPPDWGNLGS
ncbi:hypothetical protein CCHL11_00821 [Colletotrichum chlorophyti]|uniref:Rhodopsin domain-containing protein n=1 Tax=Colletotrichum chlorophyti TaxID=708187 RepID=A0A1Q8S5E5_9PEZI|nr:hypothetical protein CCHL11_00821 [Colletotrichum chlorophyti]